MTDKIDILRRYTAQPGPVDTVGLIRALGIDYAEEPMPAGDSGRIVCDADGRCRIIVNMAERPQRKRFTAAHELAHFLLHPLLHLLVVSAVLLCTWKPVSTSLTSSATTCAEASTWGAAAATADAAATRAHTSAGFA